MATVGAYSTVAISISIADVISDVQFRLHLPSIGSTTFITNAQALLLTQRAVGRLGAMLTRAFGDSYWARTATLATQANLDLVSLPQDFTTLTSLHWIDGTHAHLLERAHDTTYSANPQAWDSSGDIWTYGRRSSYVIEANTIRLIPAPTQVYTLRCAYQTGLSISSLTDTIQCQDQSWPEWLALDICEVIRQREDKDSSNFSQRKVVIEDQLKTQASQRDRNGVTQVRDVRHEDCYGYGLWPFNRSGF